MRYLSGFGTKTYRNPDGTVTIAHESIGYKPEEGAVEVHGVRDIKIHFPLEGPITADIDILVVPAAPVLALPKWFGSDVDGVVKEIASIHFKDGTTRELP